MRIDHNSSQSPSAWIRSLFAAKRRMNPLNLDQMTKGHKYNHWPISPEQKLMQCLYSNDLPLMEGRVLTFQI